MVDYLTLTEFVPGTKAKAQEVNANFSALKDAVSQKASLDGDSTQIFSVADATLQEHAVNKRQLAELSEDLVSEVHKAFTKFCVKSGNTTSGKGDLFSYNLLEITPKIGGVYSDLVISDYRGVQKTISAVSSISMSGKPNGSYNIFISPNGQIYALSNTIYRQAARPTMLSGDIWLNTSAETFNCVKYSGTEDAEFLDVPLGTVTVASSLISKIETFEFNQNGYNVNTQSSLKPGTTLAAAVTNLPMPNFSAKVTKAWNADQTAESDGWLQYIVACNAAQAANFTLNGILYTLAYQPSSTQISWSGWIPISKGTTYKFSGGYAAGSAVLFYPAKGV